jgi:hypothetical protein
MTYQEQKAAQERDAAQAIMQDYLRVLRTQFYLDDERLFYKHKFMLMQGIAYPAKVLKKLGVWLPPKRICQILDEIIRGIQQKGNTAHIDHFCGYFLTCVQSHVNKRRDRFYDEGKTARALAVGEMPLQDILKGVTVKEAPTETAEQTVERLVEIAAAFRPRRKPKTVGKQLDLL